MMKLPSGQPSWLPGSATSDAVDATATAAACLAFEEAISRYVDGETEGLDHERVVRHLHACANCRGFAESLRRMADLHRAAAGGGPPVRDWPADVDLVPDSRRVDGRGADRDVPPEPGAEPSCGFPAELPGFDLGAEFAALARRLYDDNILRLAGVCYELGKAYILAGTGQLGVRLVASRPKPIGRMRDRGVGLRRESVDLAQRAGVKPPRLQRGLFRGPTRPQNQSLEVGRRYLRACLQIDPTHANARLYLGHYFRAVGRLDRARAEFLRVARADGTGSAASRRTRRMALIKLGMTFAYERRYLKAIGCFRKVWESAGARRDPLVGMASGANLAIFTAKIERFDLSLKYFDELIRAFPGRAEDLRRMLVRQAGFKDLLRRKADFRDRLKERYPLLFAS